MRDAALRLVHQGVSVIPVKDKRPLVPWQEFQGRRATDDEIAGWTERWPDAGLGIVTGRISGLVVVDIDGEIRDVPAFVAQHVPQPTVSVQTPRGGLHLYYQHPGTGTVPNGVRVAMLGGFPVDIRGDGGFVVAPPTPGYRALSHWHAQAPWRDWLTGHQPATSLADIRLDTSVDDLFLPATLGGRNQHAARLAGYLLKTCKDADAAYAQLKAWNARNDPPLTEFELRRTFTSIAKREQAKPFDPPTTAPAEPDWLEGDAWAAAAAAEPERLGQRLSGVPICVEHQGFCPGDIITLAARPGTGKTSLVANLFWEIGKGLGESAFFFSGDMSPAQLLQWMTKARLGVSRYSPEDWQQSLQLLRDSRMAIKYSGFIATERIADVLSRRPGTRYVVVDHFNKMRTGSDTRASDLKRVASEIKDLAGQYGVTFLILSQLTRLADNVEDLLPSHLSESDALVQESDVIYGLSVVGDRTKADPDRSTVRLALLKNRFGREFVEQIAYFHKATKQFQWLPNYGDVTW